MYILSLLFDELMRPVPECHNSQIYCHSLYIFRTPSLEAIKLKPTEHALIVHACFSSTYLSATPEEEENPSDRCKIGAIVPLSTYRYILKPSAGCYPSARFTHSIGNRAAEKLPTIFIYPYLCMFLF